MDRSSRRAKPVNYRESNDFDDDDADDFASARAPPSKRPRENVKHQQRKSSSQESNSESSQKIRKPLDEKLLARDLEAAITLSMLNNAEETKISDGNIKVELPADENTDPSSLLLSNCSVNAAVLGLDEITSEKALPPSSRQRRAEEPRRKSKEEDNDEYQPKMTPDTDSDEDLSETDESEDEEFTVTKVAGSKKKEVVAKKKTRSPPASTKEKQPSKSKTVAAAATTAVTAPPAAKPAPKRPISNSATPPSKPAVSPSPPGGRIPKWNPPGQLGKSPGSSHNASVKSPGQGLRLGLSRRVRVKPLHPSVASH